MNPKTCIIIDDEPNARLLLKSIIQDYIPELLLVAEGSTLIEGVKHIHKFKPQLVFLDIEMPVHSGLDILDFFNDDELNFDIIFTTAYNQFAIQAFKLSAVDYLLKPIQHEVLQESIKRYFTKQNKSIDQLKTLRTNLNPRIELTEKKIALPLNKVTRIVAANDIIMVKGDGSYCDVHLRSKEVITLSRNLKFFEELTQGISLFFRCHRSYIINPNWVKEVYKSDGGYLQLENQLTASISSEKIDELLKIL